MSHIAIVGAGITGVTTAYELLNRGHKVTVLDRHRYPAMETSFANGGQLSACNAEAWNSTSMVLKGLRWMFRRDAPLLMNPKPSWHKYSWMGEFVGNIRNYRQHTIETTRLAIAARQRLFELAERENIAFDLERRGILHIYHDKAAFDAASAVNQLLQAGGLERRVVSPEDIRAIEPTLQSACYGGFFTPSDATGDIHKFTRGVAEACIRRGAQFIQDVDVNQIRHVSQGLAVDFTEVADDADRRTSSRQSIRPDAIVICAGVASRAFAAMLGDRLNIYPVKGYSITVPLDTIESRDAAPRVSLLDEAAKIVSSRFGDDRLRVAGTAEFNGYNRDIRADRISPLTDWVRRHFSGIETSAAVPWAGLRPMMPGMMPVVRAGTRPGVYYNTGHGHLGWTLCTATAEMVSGIIDQQLQPSAA